MLLFRTSLALCLLLLVASCGFQPLYGSRTQDADVQRKLSEIYIVPIRGQTGHYLRNELLDLTTPYGIPKKPVYRLEVSLQETISGLAIKNDDTTTRFNLTLNTQFRVRNITEKDIVYSASTQTIAAYNVVASEFANFAAENNARKRAALVAAEQIHQQLSVYFSGR
jgi:LPS-assembly lipoprotein